jgi:hypothetical protein
MHAHIFTVYSGTVGMVMRTEVLGSTDDSNTSR